MMQQLGSIGAFWCSLPDFLRSSLVSFSGLLYKTVSTDVIGRAPSSIGTGSQVNAYNSHQKIPFANLELSSFFLCPISLSLST
jgi:hypothetical protein